ENGEHTCDECSSLDGQIFDSIDEIPEKPHPNCKCMVEILDDNSDFSKNKNNDDDEPCDCWDKIDALVEEAAGLQNELETYITELDDVYEEDYNLLSNIRDFKQQVEISQEELDDIEQCGENCVAYLTGMAVNISNDKTLEDTAEKIFNLTEESRQVYQIFLEHKHEMEETRDGMDKYYHAKANCTAAELGLIQELWAVLLSISKEVKDFVYKVFKYHMAFKDVAQDCLQDLKADWYGIQKAKEHGYCSDKVKDVYKDVFNKY
ncbi:hypothetical protein IJ818_00315, partial [bacterium]|nr:hypothetical protein [bacterium]